MTEAVDDHSDDALRKAIELLSEHFDTVQIIATRQDDEDPENDLLCEDGSGSIFARIGSVRDWLMRQDEYTRNRAKKEWEYEEEDD